MLEGTGSRREPQAEEEGRASLNNESIDPSADDGLGCYGDRCSVYPECGGDVCFPETHDQGQGWWKKKKAL